MLRVHTCSEITVRWNNLRVSILFCLDELLEDFRRHQEGPEPSMKLKDSVQSQVRQIKKFLGFMAVGKSHLATLEFLDNPSRIREYATPG